MHSRHLFKALQAHQFHRAPFTQARESSDFKPKKGFQELQTSTKSEGFNSQVSVGFILENIVSKANRDCSVLHIVKDKVNDHLRIEPLGLAPEGTKPSTVWKSVFESKVSYEPRPETSFSEWLIYVDVMSPTKDSIHAAKIIVRILDANHDDPQLDTIKTKLSVPDVTRILTKLKSPKSAFVFYKWVRRKSYYIADKSVYTALIERLITLPDLDTWDQVHFVMKDMIRSKTAADSRQFGRLFTLIKAGGPSSTSRTELYVECLLKMKPLGLDPWFSTYEKVMKMCNKLEMYKSTLSVFKAIPTNSYCWAFTLALSACRCTSNLALAEELFKEMKCKNLKLDSKCCNDLLVMYASHGDADKAKDLLEEMKNSGMLIDLRNYTSVIHAYGNVGRVKEAEDIFRSIEQKLDPGIYRAMAACYRNAGHFNELLALLRQGEGSRIGATCFASAFEACVGKSEWKIAVEIMNDMQELGMSPSPRLYHLILLACSNVNDYSACKVVDFNLKEMDGLSLEEYERIIKMYISMEKVPCVLEALELLNERGLGPPTADLFEHLILTFCKTSLTNAREMYDIMRSVGHIPSSSVFTTLIQEHIRVKDMSQSRKLHDDMVMAGFQLEEPIASLFFFSFFLEMQPSG